MEKLFYLTFNLSTTSVLATVGALLFVYMALCSLLAIAKKRADLADIVWGTGFVLVAWTSLYLSQFSVYGLIVSFLITIWAIRLSLHIYFRNRGRQEDFRYQTLQKNWGEKFNFKLFSEVFLLQGAILYVVALPIMWINTHPNHFSADILRVALPIWLAGFIIEAIADYQLTLFKKEKDNQGKLLTRGLWSYVRHPNYLGELMQWWAIWLMAAPLPFGWALIISPLLLTFLIVRVSGIRPLEIKMQLHPDFNTYAKNTPSLIPPSLVNGLFYGVAWITLIIYGAKGDYLAPILIAFGCYGAQIALITLFDRKILGISIILSIFSLCLGFLQEMLFIQLGILAYPNDTIFPPFWLLALYPLFALTLNASLSFLNKNLVLPFFLGGIGALLSYLSGEKLGGVKLFPPYAYPVIFVCWGTFLTILISINKKLTGNKTDKTDL